MEIQYKAVGVSGLKQLQDEGNGLVRAIVSVTGIRDNVNDVIEPGAYAKSLQTRTPKGVWHHNWHESVSRTEDIKELLPGDPDLPKSLPNGQPWPSGAGALQVDTRFNLKTQRGREAYEDVIFFGDQQEWSIGYNVPVGGSTVDSKTGIRSIKHLDLYEYSPVLFGAMPAARTGSVKAAQSFYSEVKSLKGEEADTFLMEMKSILGDDFESKSKVADDEEVEDDDPAAVDDDYDYAADEDEEDEEDDDEVEEKALAVATKPELIRNAIDALTALLGDNPNEDTQEEKSFEYGGYEQKTLADIVSETEFDHIMDDAEAFDDGVESGDVELMEKSATAILDFAEALMDFGQKADVLPITEHIAEQFADVLGEGEDVDEGDEFDAEDSEEESDEATEGSGDLDGEADSVDEAKTMKAGVEFKTIDVSLLERALSED